MAVTVALTDNFSRELGSDFYIRERVVVDWSIVFGSKSEAPKPELSPNYVAGSSLGANKNLMGTL